MATEIAGIAGGLTGQGGSPSRQDYWKNRK